MLPKIHFFSRRIWMRAMLLHHIVDLDQNPAPLVLAKVPRPEPEASQILIRVTACGVCHTE
jgi:propanol-preferring alcohol dehydrogenase